MDAEVRGVIYRVLAHPRVLAWQRLWSQDKYDHDAMMDSEEAIARFWD